MNKMNAMNNHFNQYQMKHIMMIINDYQQKFQKLENYVQFLQSQMKFVLNELDSANRTIECQSKQIISLIKQNQMQKQTSSQSSLTQKLKTKQVIKFRQKYFYINLCNI